MRREDPRRWERAAERENKRRAAGAPLLAYAGLIPLTTPGEQQARVERMQAASAQQLQAGYTESLRRAARYRVAVAAAVPAADLAALDGGWERSAAPHTAEYLADYWHAHKRRLGLCNPDPLRGWPICNCVKEE
jgi:hypothetical protein